MSQIESLFVTRLYHAALSELGKPIDPEELEASCWAIAEEDEAGQDWCEENGYPGYTSYASLDDLTWRSPVFKDLRKVLNKHVKAFCRDLEFNLDGRKLVLEDLWINILPEGGYHSAHIHPHSVISGTTYVAMPEGASPLRFEDPRHASMMAAPPRTKHARREMQSFIYAKPQVGDVLLWESWLRHEVLMNQSEEERISVSFNYKWGD
ncbi:2OG-Fe(II) oxygenase family protein [Aliiroseovarius subalbicans]|uniref:2OG-Fe(II) oxygenase family protein n=1 Tax=Aliiroseovarius subalbicans TaxID=2925840 RepID=UPI001F586DF1|nr:2OG-Fe(II) oxygenase family protein [Aliiroseovarius subalbicans]MCI2401071.1 2OG-Fe(II) oxygenase family protein [Aliiroseovarius subalbicans]